MIRYFNVVSLVTFALLGMIAILLWTLRGVVFAHTDDAQWYLLWYLPGIDPVAMWGFSQGRLYAFVAGSMMSHALHWFGTPYGELIKLGPYVVSVILFGIVVKEYFGWRLASATVAFIVGLGAVRWDGSAIMTYPLLVWPAVISSLTAILVMRRYLNGGRRLWLPPLFASTGFSMFTNEAVTLGLLSFYAFAWCGNVILRQPAGLSGPRWPRPSPRDLHVGGVCAAAIALYALAYIAFAHAFPSSYPGKQLDFTRPIESLDTLMTFALNGSVLFSLVKPYDVTFSQPLLGSHVVSFYGLEQAIGENWSGHPEVFIFSVLCALLLAVVFFGGGSPAAEQAGQAKFRPAVALLPGAAFAVTFVFPVAFSIQYLEWHVKLGVDSYVTTCVSHFGVSLFLAGAALSIHSALRKPALRNLFAIVVVCLMALLAAANERLNLMIVGDIRAENARFAAFDRGLRLIGRAEMDVRTLVLPQYSAGSWYTAVPETYWSQLAAAKYRRPLKATFGTLVDPAAPGSVVLTYFPNRGSAGIDVIVGHVVPSARPYFDTIAVELGGDRRRAEFTALSYMDVEGRFYASRVSALDALPGRKPAFILRDVKALPGSVHLLEQADVQSIRRTCPSVINEPMTLSFDTLPQLKSNICSAAGVLESGWGNIESTGVWTSTDVATLRLPRVSGVGHFSVRFAVATLTSLNFAKGTQKVKVFADGTPVAEWSFPSGGPPSSEFDVPITNPNAARGVELRFEIDKPINLKERGEGADGRSLGLHLHSLEVRPGTGG